MALRIPSTRRGWLRLALGGVAVIAALLVGLSGPPASADRPDPTPGWDLQHRHAWNGYPQTAPYGYGPHGTYRRQPTSCGTNTVVGAAFGAGVGGLIGSQLSDRPDDAGPTVMGMLIGAIFGGILGQSADRANGC
jgi:hypothetical protein